MLDDPKVAAEANYAANVMESALDSLLQVPGAVEAQLRDGLNDLRSLDRQPSAGVGWIVHKSTALR